jgi:hypothetical protein
MTNHKVNGVVREPPPDAATLGDEIALLSDEASGLLLSHPRGLAFTSPLSAVKGQLLALVEELRRTAPLPAPLEPSAPGPAWPACPLDRPAIKKRRA